MDQVEVEIPLEKFADETPRLPLLLACGLGDVPSFLLGRLRREVGVRRLLDGGCHMALTLS